MKRGNRIAIPFLTLALSLFFLLAGGRSAAGSEDQTLGLLQVVVTDAGGYRSLGEARVDLRRQAGPPLCGYVSDANGMASVRLAPGEYEITGAVCPGYTYEGPDKLVTVEAGSTRRVVLDLTPDLRGVVRDPYGNPVAQARIQIVGAGREEVVSDWQGRFAIAWQRQCQFRTASEFYLVARSERRNLATAVTVTRGTEAVEVRLQPAVTLTGQAVNLINRGIAHAWVYATWDVPNWGGVPLAEEQIETDGSGRFELTALPPGVRYTIHVRADGYGCREMALGAGLEAGRVFDVGMLSLSSASLSVSGRVHDAQGRPVANATVYGWGPGQPIKLRTQTNEEGQFLLVGVCPGQVNLRVDGDLGDGQRTWTHALANAGASDLELGPRGPWGK